MSDSMDDYIEYSIFNSTGGTIIYRINTGTGEIQQRGSLKPGKAYVCSRINEVIKQAAIDITSGELKDIHEYDPTLKDIPIDERKDAVYAKLYYLQDRMTYDQIGAKLCVSRSKVYSWLKKMKAIRHPKK